jgi:hypothetical protein
MAGGTNVCITWHASPAKKWDDLFSAKSPWPFGTTGPADSRYQHTAILRNMFGAKVKPIPGYTGSSEVRLAMERGEITGNCGDSWSSLKSTASDWLKERKINMIAQFAIEKHKELPNVPLIVDLAKSDLDRAGAGRAGRDAATRLRRDHEGSRFHRIRQQDEPGDRPGEWRRGRKAHHRNLPNARGGGVGGSRGDQVDGPSYCRTDVLAP